MLSKKSLACILLHQHWCIMNEKRVENAVLATKPPSVQVTVMTYLIYLRANTITTNVEREQAS